GLLREASADRLSSCELVPHEALELVLQHIPSARSPGVGAAPWYLLVELTSSGEDELDALLEAVLASALARGLVLDAVIAHSEARRENLWRLRESIPEAQRLAGGSLKHDISVPIAAVPAFIEQGAALIEQLVPEGFLVAYGHIGDGNLHFNVNQRPGTVRDSFLQHESALKRAVHDLVARHGGSFSAEHGIGQLKVEELERYAAPAELAAMRRIKLALDPNGIMNPGKILKRSAT
ncbi:MAG TPA: FAD-linked oxidase C-terminal domain-containing protein, partial [Steroidobacteraceae bacterium]|nr:FAD-linked oxidase C-terminal domain-containing protein [Steroidobacteraceae bacterium]